MNVIIFELSRDGKYHHMMLIKSTFKEDVLEKELQTYVNSGWEIIQNENNPNGYDDYISLIKKAF